MDNELDFENTQMAILYNSVHPGKFNSRKIFFSVALACIGTLFGSLTGAAQSQTKEAIIEGQVCSADRSPLAGAIVELKKGDKTTVTEATTDGAGHFFLKAEKGKSYQLRARKEAYEPRVLDVGPLGDENKKIDLFLTPVKPKGAAGFEFTDPPEFTVAGVTDWSNVGLHGSDANVKTSEALTKETARLKASDAGDGAGAVGAGTAHRLAGDEKEKSGDPVGAEREYAEAVKLEPSEENYFVWGRELLLHRAGKAAVEVLSKGAKMYPASERMKEALGAAYYADGQYLEAAQQVCLASDLKPRELEPYLILGRMEQAANEILPSSEEKLKRFAIEQPGDQKANFFYGLVIWKKARKTQNEVELGSATEYLKRAASMEPALGEIYVQLGMVYDAQGKKEAALAEFRKAVVASPELSGGHYQLSLAYRRGGQIAKADEEMKKYDALKRLEDAELEKERKEMRQFITVFKQTAPN
jgi:tetratricopeptide (TPR) repeat protein